ncbi:MULTISPECIES: SsrA-binding protein SmpB [unclassified Campylobacter]|uniref:SsrA-binding protein SmpB n=1 Tax=unclassified Campylobacter TaxID=2593542 RepID=UPI0022E9B53E|nr:MULTISPECIES: SsrA-binding protein SmpB [unclassified Campylobacter]MDA3055700.1 SsrA-binding protein SmpB [Campylobacter sp. CN_NA1]MDA3065036.1 SsrA-binding protein SmpB [Campylobacter sp. CN_NE4]MDA3069193.1 SsrA-binding protein SmpB [Campylobacter sp. CN_NE3]MDA3082121.1 SsrA-binding protein SmpB [Campylobacter sp. CN_EL2]MDA3083756.1 SsrA-binding protein SmpB [Campylobacter sp. CN_NE1]
MKELARNKKAYHDFTILEKFEAGIVLKGSEVKSLRAGRANLKDSFCRVIKGELFLLNAHISYLETTNSHFRPNERAARKLLMHRKQIDKLLGSVTKEGLTLVVLSLYLNDKNIVKANIALAKGKNLHDKREALKRKDADREARSAMKKYV